MWIMIWRVVFIQLFVWKLTFFIGFFTLKVEFLTLYILHDCAAATGNFRSEWLNGKTTTDTKKKAKIKPSTTAAQFSITRLNDLLCCIRLVKHNSRETRNKKKIRKNVQQLDTWGSTTKRERSQMTSDLKSKRNERHENSITWQMRSR